MANLPQSYGQIVADSIRYELPLKDNKEVSALFTNMETTFNEIQHRRSWTEYDSTYADTTNTALWIKFAIENKSKDTILNYLYSIGHNTTIYQQKKQGFEKIENGFYFPRLRHANKSENNFTLISLEPFQKSEVYLRINLENSPKISNIPSIYSETGYLKFSRNDYREQANSVAFIYFYIISLLTIIIFAFVFWVRLSEKLYLYYLGYLFFQLVYGFIVLRNTVAQVGNVFTFIPRVADDLFEPVQFAFIGFYIFFILNLLQVKRYNKLLGRVLKYLGLACFIYAISRFLLSHFFYDPEIAQMAFTIVRLIILPINFILIFWIVFKVKHPLLNYFIYGQSFFFIGALVSSYVGYYGLQFSPDSIFNFKEAPNIIFQIGLLAEVYCFSLALGQNVFLLQKEKTKTNDELIEQLQKNQLLQEGMNRELDEKVHKKTEELIQVYTEIEKEREQKIKDDFSQRIRETEMVALRSQMNPHFIFNSLSAIKDLMMTSRNEAAIDYLDDFSSLLREILQNSNRKKITVEEELEIIELYLSLEQNRMGTDFKYNIDVSSREELSQYQIPPLLLQPIVENAIWHGLHPSLKAEKKLKIIFDTTDNLSIIIEDNGIGRKESAKKKKLHNSMGTPMVKDRLTLYNHLNENAIQMKTCDLEEEGMVLGTRITLTYQY